MMEPDRKGITYMGKRIDDTACHCLKMRRSAENVVRFYDRALAPAGVTVRQYSLLSAIAREPGCSVSRLAEATALDRSTLTRSLRPLMGEGLVVDGKEPGTRNSRLELSPAGTDVLERAEMLWQEAQAAYEEKLGSQTVGQLEEALLALQDL